LRLDHSLLRQENPKARRVGYPGEKGRDRSVLIGVAGEILRESTPEKRMAAMFMDSAFGAPIVERLRMLAFDNVHEVSFGGPTATMPTGVRICGDR
jgi:hypothetical protein